MSSNLLNMKYDAGFRLFDSLYNRSKDANQINEIENYKLIMSYISEIYKVLNDLYYTRELYSKSFNEKIVGQRKIKMEYSLGNFYLRWYLFREKLNQLVNSVYLQLSEGNNSLRFEIDKNQKTEAVNVILKSMEKHHLIKEILRARKLFTHQRFILYPGLPLGLKEYFMEMDEKEKEMKMLTSFSVIKMSQLIAVMQISEETFEKICTEIMEYLNKQE